MERPPEPKPSSGLKPATNVEKGSGSATHSRQRTAIVVDDEPALCLVLTAMLRGAGFRVLPCSCADEVSALLQQGVEDVSLLITDILLPGTNGRDLAKTVQSQVPGVHVIYMSGFSAGHLSEQALNEPNTIFLQKPFDRARLYAAISELSSKSKTM